MNINDNIKFMEFQVFELVVYEMNICWLRVEIEMDYEWENAEMILLWVNNVS